MSKVSKVAKKSCMFMLALTMCTGSVFTVACGGGTGNSGDINAPTDNSKTQLLIGVYEGAYGFEWTRAVADKFEEKYKDYKNGDKVGVQVKIDPQKTGFEEATLIEKLQTNATKNDVYLTCATYEELVKANVVADVTNAMNEKVYDANGEIAAADCTGTKYSLAERMSDDLQERYCVDDRYYGFPFEDSIMGIVYDADLFAQMGYEVPETMSQFYTLMDTMVDDNIIPFTWCGEAFYTQTFTDTIVAQYEGAAAASLNVTYSGTYDFNDGNGPVTITNENAYLLAKQPGKKKALEFLDKITSTEDYYTKSSYSSTSKNIQTQNAYLSSKVKAANGTGKRIAMMLEGDFWENEAKTYFNQMGAQDTNNGYGKRNFKMMPMPTMDGQKDAGKHTVVSFSKARAGFINKNAENKELAELWIQFMHSRSSLATFTSYTGSVLAYDYDLTTEEYNNLTTFKKSVWDIHRDEDVIVYRAPYSCDFFRESTTKMGGIGQDISCAKSKLPETNTEYSSKGDALKTLALTEGLTAEEYYNNSVSLYYTQATWVAAYNTFLGS